MKKISSKRGFTLVELLLVAAMLAFIGLIVYGTFVRGIDIWRRVTQPTKTEDVGLFFKNISYDLRNSFELDSIPFRGGSSEISFPTRIKRYDKEKEGIEESIGKVTYSFNRREKELYKSQADYSQIYHKRSGPKRIIAEEVSSLKFEYFIYNAQRKRYSWVTRWQEREKTFGEEVEEHLPLIVKITVGIPAGKKEQKFTKTVFIPTGCCWPYMDEEGK